MEVTHVNVARWLAAHSRRIAVAAIATAGLALAPAAAAWGPVAQQAVTLKAIDTLPKGLKEFYRAHRFEMPTLALEAKPPEDAADWRFAVDRLLPFPFSDLPITEEPFKARFGDEGARVGRLPWLVHESYARLVEAFKSGEKQRILEESDLLAALVAQLDNPLALTDNADGHKTGQHGLWVRFTVRLPEAMEKRLKLDADAAAYVDDPKRYVFAMAAASYVWVDNLLYEEELARRGQSGYNELYYEAFEQRVGNLLRARLGRAATDAGSYWYTAWSAAGRPALK
jgi:hypothetical protein